MFIVLYIKYRYCCQILMKLEFPQQIFKYILKYQIQWKFIQWEPSCSMRTDRQTDRQKDVTELIGFFFAIFPALLKILRSAHTVYSRVLCGSQNKQRLFPYTALTDWFV